MKKIIIMLAVIVTAISVFFATSCSLFDKSGESNGGSYKESISEPENSGSGDSHSDGSSSESGSESNSESGKDSADLGQRESNETPRIPLD